MKKWILRVDDAVRMIEHHLLWMLLGTIFTVLTATVFFRYVLGSPITWTEELLTMVFTWMVFIGSSAALATHQHIRIDILLRVLPKRLELLAALAAVVVCLGVFAVATFYGFRYVRTTWGDLTPMLGLTFGIYTLALPVTSLCAALHVLRNSIDSGLRGALMSTIEIQAETEMAS